ncbi:MAG: patatin-like phospholipase family protein [Nevskia sp.]|nr:patatin-like phospholipase family protein [Nevskia sp.]
MPPETPLPPRPDKNTLEAFFPYATNPPPAGTFEMGLVLGGTVSAGAYTAGALDFLFQALDAWHERAGNHKVKLKVAAGSSGGAVCAALVSVLSNRDFNHVTAPQSVLVASPPPINNQFWNIWVDAFSFDQLVDTSDLNALVDEGAGNRPDQRTPSALNCQMIDRAVQSIIQYAGQAPSKQRAWVEPLLRVGITVANLRGIPFKVEAIPGIGQFDGANFVQHDDYAWFAAPTWVTKPQGLRAPRPDEFWVADPAIGYTTMAQWAAASGAMPVGFKARLLHRPVEHYYYRPRARATMNAAGSFDKRIDPPSLDMGALGGMAENGQYLFSAVDGGTLNNDPVSLVHDELAGLIGLNPRDPQEANRAIFMIDPLVDMPTALKKVGLSMLSVTKSMVDVFVGSARYLTADKELFASDDVFSRFQLVPNRKVDGEAKIGEDALAGTALMALGGWCAPAFRVHDFLLGRANMQAYLSSTFVLRADNALFNGWTPQLRQIYAVDKGGNKIQVDGATPPQNYYLPVIPVMPGATAVAPDWPLNALDQAAVDRTVRNPLKKRVEAVLDRLREDNAEGFGPWVLQLIALPGIADTITNALVDGFVGDLQQKRLMPKSTPDAAAL